MAISLKATGAWAEAVADATPTLVGTPSAGDRYFIWATWKDFSITCTVDASSGNWVEVTEFADGSTASGNGTGSMKVGCWYRDWQVGDVNPTINFSGTPQAAYCMQLWQKSAADTWNAPTFVTAAHASSAGPVTRSASSTITVSNDSVVFALWGIADDSATFTRPTTGIDVASGITWNGNYVESPATHGSFTTGNDCAADLGHRFVTTGAAGATLRASITALTAAETGAILWVHQSVTAGTWVGPSVAAVGTVAPNVTTTTSFNIPVPTSGGTGTGIIDLVFLFNQDSTTSITPPAGLTAAPEITVDVAGARQHKLGVYWREAATSSGNYTFTFSPTGYSSGFAVRYSGVDSTSPFDVTNTAVEPGTATATTPAVSDTITVDNTLAVWASTQRNVASTSCTPPTGYTERADTGTNGCGITAADKQFGTAGGTGSITGTWAGPQAMAAWLGVLKPISAGASGTLAAANQKATASFTGVMEPSGTLAAANQKATFAATGLQTLTGTLAASNQKATAALTGVMQPSGTLAAAMQKATASLTGSQTMSGTLAAAIQKLAFTGAGAQTQTGTLSAANQKATAALLGWMEPSGTLAASLQRATMSATGAQTQTGALASAIQVLTAALSGTQVQTGVLSAATQLLTATMTGVMQPTGALAAANKPSLFTGTGAQVQQGALAAALQVLTASMVGSQEQSGSMAAAIQMLTAALSGSSQQSGTLSASVQRLVFAAAAEQAHVGALAAAAQLVVASFIGDMPMIGTLSALTQPLEADLTGAASNAPAALFATLQPMSSNLTGTMLPSGQLAAELELLAFSGLGSQTLSGSVAAALQKLSASLIGQQPFTGTLSGLLVPAQFQVTGTQAYDGVMAAELQELAAELLGGFAPPEGVLAATLPALVAGLEGTGGVPVGELSAAIPALVFSSLAKVYRLALERLTAVEIEDRAVHVSLDPRLVAVEAEDRINGVEVPPRTTAAEVDNRITTVIREG